MSLSSFPASTQIRLPGVARLLLLIPLLLAILIGWFCLRWQVGATVSEVVTAGETPNLELARVAARWAPDDPSVHWRLGVLLQSQFSVGNLEDAVRQFETAVRLAPNDFRYWQELGRALETLGDTERAERALRRAVELAPSYYYPRWRLGNFLVRRRNPAEGFQELTRAATANEELWPQVLNLAWQAFDGDVDRIANEACREPRVRTMFAAYLIGAKHPDEALRLWKTISAEERRQDIVGGRALRKAFADAKQFRAALEVHRDIEAPGDSMPVLENFSNGSFEEMLIFPVARPLGWTLVSNVQAELSISNEGHSGRHSLQIVISAANKLERINVSHTIAVEPNTQYHFECYARTFDLNSASTPIVTILDAATNSPLMHSTPLPTGSNNWQKIALDFQTKNSDGIIVMIGRLPCTVGDICPIFGTVWYDDFILQRASGGPGRITAAGANQETRATAR